MSETTGTGNSGISVGGDLHMDGSAIALNHSSATVTPGAPAGRPATIEELRTAARLLVEQLRRDREQYEDGDHLVETAELVEGELASEEPRRTRLLRWLNVLAPGVQATAQLAGDVATIQESVASLL
ncbi:hypothetical protein LO772_00420 [Yinghuangia sp. ASG 101]|uniref:hypothetical protein n=1 Tax=Yinghuangia sp. ASG 101 TaxID=2896848 RepID=UPI001E339A10|nr:hypothetical protein [Yinghuangia sp. ASG 101]UGQ12113.1 hypothetical protein LO772_00420 [Yinghuangia sp. ASG 101]